MLLHGYLSTPPNKLKIEFVTFLSPPIMMVHIWWAPNNQGKWAMECVWLANGKCK